MRTNAHRFDWFQDESFWLSQPTTTFKVGQEIAKASSCLSTSVGALGEP